MGQVTIPRDTLIDGAKILNDLLASSGFAFKFRDEGKGSGGTFAWGEFVRDERRLELHYRENLGLVTYKIREHEASHESYMRELGVWGRNRYPGFSTEYLQGFRDLLHDLWFATDFVSGDGSILVVAAQKEAIANAARSRQLYAGSVGDIRATERMQTLFHAKRYAEVVRIFDSLKFPHLLSDSQLRLVELARKRAAGT